MTDKPVISSVGSVRHANPSYFGLDWKEAEPYLREHEEIAVQARDVNAQIRELEAELAAEKRALPAKRAKAARSGSGPVSARKIEKLEKDLTVLREKSEDLQRATDLIERDLSATLETNRGEYLEQIEAMEMQARVKIREIRQQLLEPEWELEVGLRLRQYLSRPGVRGGYRFPGIGARPEVPEGVRSGGS